MRGIDNLKQSWENIKRPFEDAYKELEKHPELTDFLARALYEPYDWSKLVYDTITGNATFWDYAGLLPFVPGGLGKAKEAARIAGKAKEAARAKNLNKLSESYLKARGIDPHSLKRDHVGSLGSRYDIYKDKDTGELVLKKKGSGGTTIPTGEKLP